jgi:hypothetical protein
VTPSLPAQVRGTHDVTSQLVSNCSCHRCIEHIIMSNLLSHLLYRIVSHRITSGYRNAFPFFEEHHPELCFAGQNPRTNFKQVRHDTSCPILLHFPPFLSPSLLPYCILSCRPALKLCSAVQCSAVLCCFVEELKKKVMHE